MCFDIDVNKFTLEQLRDTLRRITMLLSKPAVVVSLPDQGHQLHQVREKLKVEIQFREGLEETCQRVQALSLKCASDTNIGSSHASKLCAFEKKPQRERFRPHLTLKPSGRTESTKELHSGTKLIDLTTSLSIQKFQEERVKEEQIRVKHERLLNFLKQNADDSDETDWILNDYDSDEGSQEEEVEEEEEETDVTVLYSVDEPGPSGLGKGKKPKEEENAIDNPAEEILPKIENIELKEEAEEEKIQSTMDTKTMNPKMEHEIIQPKADGQINVDKSKNDIEEQEDNIQLKTEVEAETEKPKDKSEGSEGEIQPSSFPKDEADMP